MSILVSFDHLIRFLNVVKDIEGKVSFEFVKGSHKTISGEFNGVRGFIRELRKLKSEHPNFPYSGVNPGKEPIENMSFTVHSFRLDEGRFIDKHLNFSMHGESTILHAEPAYKLEVDINGRISVHDFFEKF